MIHMYNVCDHNYDDDESLFVFPPKADDKCYTCALNYAMTWLQNPSEELHLHHRRYPVSLYSTHDNYKYKGNSVTVLPVTSASTRALLLQLIKTRQGSGSTSRSFASKTKDKKGCELLLASEHVVVDLASIRLKWLICRTGCQLHSQDAEILVYARYEKMCSHVTGQLCIQYGCASASRNTC